MIREVSGGFVSEENYPEDGTPVWREEVVRLRAMLLQAYEVMDKGCTNCGHRVRDSFESAKLTTGEFNEP